MPRAMALPWIFWMLMMLLVHETVDAQPETAAAEPATASALFVFGDSLSDDGNNNYLSSFAKSNFLPYGIDFPSGPTGRFCNGKIVVDFLGSGTSHAFLRSSGHFMGLPLIPAYLDPLAGGPNIMKGVNYASAAGGILDETGFNYGNRISFNQQIHNFQTTVMQLTTELGSQEAVQKLLPKAIFALEFGSNDYINNYLNPFFFSTARQYSPSNFSNLLISEYSKQLHALFNLGARKIVVSALGPLGCIPSQLAMGSPNGQCVESTNSMVQMFNSALKDLVVSLNEEIVSATFVYVDIYSIVLDMIKNPASYGFRVVNEGCCGFGRYRGQLTCILLVRPCANRTEYVFWDAFHPTEAVNAVIATKAFNGKSSETFPMNISSLVLL